jgi:hypothetical protein
MHFCFTAVERKRKQTFAVIFMEGGLFINFELKISKDDQKVLTLTEIPPNTPCRRN